MVFLWPQLLFLLFLVPVLVALYIWAQYRRKKYAVRYASLSIVKEAIGKGPGWRRHIPPALFLLALILMLFALARPMAIVSLPAQEGTVVLAIDVSGSMFADDLKPSRMEAAKDAARTFVSRQPQGIKIAVVSFSDNAFIVQAPTTDKDAAISSINRLQPQRGTAIGRGILTSLDALFEGSDEGLPSADFNSSQGNRPISGFAPTPRPTLSPKSMQSDAIVVLVTDGENNVAPAPLDVAPEAAKLGIRVYTIGIGTPEGTILKVQGRSVRVRLDEQTLKKIADATQADYFNASSETDLKKVYENLSTHLVIRTERTEITALFTALAAAFALAAGALSLFWFNRLP
jgi:Ca-activated chloride channel family protein